MTALLERIMKLLERLMTALVHFVAWLIERIGLPDDDYDDGGDDE